MTDTFGGEFDLLVRMEKGRTRIATVFIPWLNEQIRLMNTQLLVVPVYPVLYKRTVDTLLARKDINYVEQRIDPVNDANFDTVRVQMEMVFYVGAQWQTSDGNINGDGIGKWLSKGTIQSELTLRHENNLHPTGSPWPEG